MRNVHPSMFVAAANLGDGGYALVIREEHHAEYGPSPVWVIPYGNTVPVIYWCQEVFKEDDYCEFQVAFSRPGTTGLWLAMFRASEDGNDYYREWKGIDTRYLSSPLSSR